MLTPQSRTENGQKPRQDKVRLFSAENAIFPADQDDDCKNDTDQEPVAGMISPLNTDEQAEASIKPPAKENAAARPTAQSRPEVAGQRTPRQALHQPQMKRVPIRDTRITSKYGNRVHPVTGKVAFHNGVDFSAKLNQRVYAVLDGGVKRSGPRGDLGIAVEIYHPSNRTSTIYGHLNEELVYAGQQVKAGQLIGLAGTTGRSTGVHLHFTVKQDKRYLEPLAYLDKLPRYMPDFKQPVHVARALGKKQQAPTIAKAPLPTRLAMAAKEKQDSKPDSKPANQTPLPTRLARAAELQTSVRIAGNADKKDTPAPKSAAPTKAAEAPTTVARLDELQGEPLVPRLFGTVALMNPLLNFGISSEKARIGVGNIDAVEYSRMGMNVTADVSQAPPHSLKASKNSAESRTKTGSNLSVARAQQALAVAENNLMAKRTGQLVAKTQGEKGAANEAGRSAKPAASMSDTHKSMIASNPSQLARTEQLMRTKATPEKSSKSIAKAAPAPGKNAAAVAKAAAPATGKNAAAVAKAAPAPGKNAAAVAKAAPATGKNAAAVAKAAPASGKNAAAVAKAAPATGKNAAAVAKAPAQASGKNAAAVAKAAPATGKNAAAVAKAPAPATGKNAAAVAKAPAPATGKNAAAVAKAAPATGKNAAAVAKAPAATGKNTAAVAKAPAPATKPQEKPVSRIADGARLASEIARELSHARKALEHARKRSSTANMLYREGAISAKDAKRRQAEVTALEERINNLEQSGRSL